MNLIKSVINLLTFLIVFALGVEGLDMVSKIINGEAIKAHKRSVMSLQQWNAQLLKKTK